MDTEGNTLHSWKIHRTVQNRILERRTNKKENTLPKNLPKVAKDALKDLSSRYDIIIFKADKGGAAEIIDNDNCINKAKR